MLKVGILMGSYSDLDVLKPAFFLLKEFGIPYEAHVMSAHRTPEETAAFSQNASSNGFGVLIAAAGKAAHLAGCVAAQTVLPVIGLPVKSSTMDGLDSLLSTVNMPSGIPVATVSINGGENAALLAAQILALGNPELRGKLLAYKKQLAESTQKADMRLQQELLGGGN